MGCPIDVERRGCKSIGYYTHIVTLNCDLTYLQGQILKT